MTLKQVVETNTYLGKSYKCIYKDSDDFSGVPKNQKGQSVHAICYCDGKLVLFSGLVKYPDGVEKKFKRAGVVGEIDPPESTIDNVKKESTKVLKRVIRKELNAKVIKLWPLGFDYLETGMYYHLHYVCLIESLGAVVLDPSSVIKKISLIKPKDYKKYINSETVSRQIERSLEIVGKAT